MSEIDRDKALRLSIRDRVLVHLDFSVDQRRFGRWVPGLLSNPADPESQIRPTASDAHRNDLVLGAGVLVDVDLTRVFGLTLGYRFSTNLTDFTPKDVLVYLGSAIAFDPTRVVSLSGRSGPAPVL